MLPGYSSKGLERLYRGKHGGSLVPVVHQVRGEVKVEQVAVLHLVIPC